MRESKRLATRGILRETGSQELLEDSLTQPSPDKPNAEPAVVSRLLLLSELVVSTEFVVAGR